MARTPKSFEDLLDEAEERRLVLEIDVTRSNYWKRHPEKPKDSRDEDVVTRCSMRQRILRAIDYAFRSGVNYVRRVERDPTP